MKIYLKISLFVACLGLLISCNSSNQNTSLNSPLDQKASWLLGTWKQQNVDGTAVEFWQKINDSTYQSFSYFIQHGDTLSSERIQLVNRQGTLFFIPTVKGQNNNQAVEFKAVTVNDHELIFENPSHDFPQRVRYSLPKNDSLYAEISGKVQGEEKSMGFPYHKAH